jgi:superfamily II DNA or RNA helicase
LRSGAGPFRSLGRLSLRPRPYQVVPLLMALRLETVRLLISDDVGIGKTIEAGLIARELLDRGEIRRIAVLCPPHLCDQWQRELRDKFNIDAVVIRSGTVSKLERQLPSGDQHIFSYYRHVIVSLDYAKSERRRASFITHCPDFVIVDEAHTCTRSGGQGSAQQQRHQLVQDIAVKSERHLVLLSATPHSGIEDAFLSLLGLLKPEFEQLNLDALTQEQRDRLASHFVQRRRADVKQWLGDDTPFPERESIESAYRLSKDYRALFEQVYAFARGLLKTGDDDLSYAQRRGQYWAALALIRCVMSSPAAAVATLTRQVGKGEMAEELALEPDEALMSAYVYDPTEQEQAVDAVPSVAIEQSQQCYGDSERRALRSFVQAAEKLMGAKDAKLQAAISIVEGLLKEGLNPIIWCRYIATAEYVAQALRQKLEKKGANLRVIPITGAVSEDEREARLEELSGYAQRVLVATDCLSEGVNLQEHFSAVIHYDLPWNPNRLEQREGRIDRYGQAAPVVKSFLLHGQDNPVDTAVLEVLIRKAVEIHRTLGITVPVPMESASVSEAVFQSLFERSTASGQLSLFESSTSEQLSLLDLLDDSSSALSVVHQRWEQAVDRERTSRTKFAQRTIKPVEVERELIESDQVLGSEADVERFVKTACDRLNCPLVKKKQGWLMQTLPAFLTASLGTKSRLIAFTTPVAEGVEYVGRNHPLVEGIARYLLEEALDKLEEPTAARCGFVVTDGVEKRTTLLLLRLRHLLDSPKRESLLAEECIVAGFTGSPSNPIWLETEQALSLLQRVEPVSDMPLQLKRNEIQELLDRLDELQDELDLIAEMRSQVLSQSHRRVRAITKEGQVKVKPQTPMDILGVYILQPGSRKKS